MKNSSSVAPFRAGPCIFDNAPCCAGEARARLSLTFRSIWAQKTGVRSPDESHISCRRSSGFGQIGNPRTDRNRPRLPGFCFCRTCRVEFRTVFGAYKASSRRQLMGLGCRVHFPNMADDVKKLIGFRNEPGPLRHTTGLGICPAGCHQK